MMMDKVNAFIRFKIAAFLMLVCCMVSCDESYQEKFTEELNAGNLTAAQEFLIKIDDTGTTKRCAINLIKAYLDAGAISKAVNVYENITSWHADKSDLNWDRNWYERDVCKLLREHLIRNGEYDKALDYYPIRYSDENYIGNAPDRYTYISDVVADLCAKGKQEEARKFIEYQLRWFVINVDSYVARDDADVEEKNMFGSNAVRTKLLEQIDNSY